MMKYALNRNNFIDWHTLFTEAPPFTNCLDVELSLNFQWMLQALACAIGYPFKCNILGDIYTAVNRIA